MNKFLVLSTLLCLLGTSGLWAQTVVPRLRTSPLPADSLFCRNSNVVFSVDSLASTAQYLWSTGATTNFITVNLTQDTQVRVTVTQPGNTTSLISPYLRVAPVNLNLSLSRQVRCSNDLVNATITGLGNLCSGCSVQVLSTPSNLVVANANAGMPASFNNQNWVAGDYYARIAGPSGQAFCSQFSNFVKLDTADFQLQLVAAPGDSVCAGTAVDLVATANCPTCTYTWSGNPSPSNRITVNQPGTYGLTLSQPGSGCTATAQRTIVATAPQFDTLVLMPVSIGTVAIRLDSLIDQAAPGSVLNRPLEFLGVGIQGGLGSGFTFTPPASALNTLHPITVRSYQGSCFSEKTMFIPVIPDPVFTGLDRQYCLASPVDTLFRDPNYNYQTTNTGTRITYRQVMQVTAQNYGGTLTPLGSANPQLQYFLFNPAQITGSFAVLTVRYRTFIEDYDALGNLLQTRSYTVGLTSDTITRVPTINAAFTSTAVTYCKDNTFRQVNVQPGGGSINVRRLNGLQANTDTVYAVTPSGDMFFNPFLVHGNETVDLNLQLTYTVGSGACAVSVQQQIQIPAPANSAFATQRSPNTALRRREYCIGEPSDPLIVTSGVNGVFTINGSLSNPPVFNPVTAGQFLVAFSASNAAGCTNTRTDTFVVNPLPVVSFNTNFATFRCVYDSNMIITGLPAGGGLSITTRSLGFQNVANSYNLVPANILGSSTLSDTALFRYGYTDPSTGCTDTITRSVFLHPRPVLSMTPLAPTYCQNSPIIELDPRPVGGVLEVYDLLGGTATANLQIAQRRYNPLSATATNSADIIQYSYQDLLTTCRDTIRDSVQVIPQPGANLVFGQNLPNQYCFYGDTLVVLGQPGNALPGGAGFAGFSANHPAAIVRQVGGGTQPVSDSAFVVPNLAQTGDFILYYTFNNGACSRTIADTMAIRPLPRLDFRFIVPAAIRSSLYPTLQDTFCYSLTDSVRIEVRDLNSAFPGSPIPAGTANFAVFGDKVRFNQWFYPDSAGFNIVRASRTNDFGCLQDTLAFVTVLDNPEPVISGLNALYCTGSPADTILGVPTGGSWRMFDGLATYQPTAGVINTAQARLDIEPGLALLTVLNPGSMDLIYQYTNSNTGCTNRSSQNFAVTAPPTLSLSLREDSSTTINITGGGIIVCENRDPVGLEAYANNIYIPRANGLFRDTLYSNGIINDTAFVPGAGAGTRIIRFEFVDPGSGCVGDITTSLFVETAPSANIIGLDTTYCVDNAPDIITEASTGVNVQAQVYRQGGGPGLIALGIGPTGRERFELNPADFGVGVHNIQVAAVSSSGCRDTADFGFLIRGLPIGVAIDNRQPLLCSNEGSRVITAFPPLIPGATGRFRLLNAQGAVVDTSVGSTSIFDLQPALRAQQSGFGDYRLVFEYRDPNSCANYDTSNFRLHAAPRAEFIQRNFCLGDAPYLESRSDVPMPGFINDTISEWIWSYQGRTFMNTSSPTFNLGDEPAGWGLAQLTVITEPGCADTVLSGLGADTVFIFNKPQVAFNGLGGCQGDSVLFTPQPTGLLASFGGVALDRIDRWVWHFGDGDSSVSIPPASSNLINLSPISHPYSQPGVYFPRLRISNRGLCVVEDTLRFVVSPTVILGAERAPYFQNFEQNSGQWFQSEPDSQAIWQWGVANGSWLNTPNNKVWSLRDSGRQRYPAGRTSWVFGPCLDLRESYRPMLKMDLFTDMFNFDGVVLEYYDDRINPDNGQAFGWRSLGLKDKGVKWYNSPGAVFGLLPLKRDNLRFDHLDGWTGRFLGRRSARYRLDELRGRRNVRIRLAFGSLEGADCSGSNCPQGFAFDNFWVGERRRNALVEYFTNVLRPDMELENQQLYGQLYNQVNGADVVLVQYHTQNAGPDPVNELNVPDHNARTFYYGANDAEVVVDGKIFKGAYNTIEQWDLDSIMLADPGFSIEIPRIQIDIQANSSLTLRAKIKALELMPRRDYVLHAAILQDSFVTVDGIRNEAVMRKLLPGHGDLRANRAFDIGDSILIEETWIPNSNTWAQLEDTGKLYAVVFIQDDLTQEIFQVATSREIDLFSLPTGISQTEGTNPLQNPRELFSVRLYPNPASWQITADWPEALESEYRWQVFNNLGQAIEGGILAPGSQNLIIPVQDLPAGLYFLRMQDNRGRGSFIQRQFVKY